ncbi:MAG: hypothetical protein ACOCWB_02485 [Bacteroidota bacterium]
MRTKFIFPFLLIVSVCVYSCSENPYERDVSDISVSVEYFAFHSEILELSSSKSPQEAVQMAKKIGPFFDSYNQRVLGIVPHTHSDYFSQLEKTLTSSFFSELYTDVNRNFSDMSPVISDIEQAFTYFKFYFPDYSIPQIVTFISGLNYSIIVDENILAIGLDKYLGSSHPLYEQTDIPSFIRKRMHQKRIPVDCMLAVADGEFSNNFEEEHLLSEMIHYGRHMYLVRSTLPYIHDTLLWGYSADQLAFCENSEKEFWKYFVSTDNMLFKTDYLIIKRFIDEGPFTPVFTKESPARIGQWIGFNVVESFMKHNSHISMQDLFEIDDPLYIMNNADYNP